jgi:hypothetical protein
MKTSKTYIVTWDQLLYNALDVDEQLSAANIDYLVFDVTTEPTVRPNWVIAEKVRYYGHFYNSLVDFATTDHDIFIFNAGDAICENHPDFVKIVEETMSLDEDIWIMAPRMSGDGSDGMVTLIQMSKKYKNLGLSTQINGIYVALSRELALFILEYYKWILKKGYMNFANSITGHCLDTVYAAWTLYNNKKIYRQWDFWMSTVPGTSYNTSYGGRECNEIKSWFKEYIDHLGMNHYKLQHIYDGIIKKDTTYVRSTMPVLEVYLNLDREKDLDY